MNSEKDKLYKWKINRIDTSEYARKFAELLEENGDKTYFLQGVWGSGKTEYLREVEEQSKGKLKFIYLELWKPKSNESLPKSLFATVKPWESKLLSVLYGIFVIITVVGSTLLALEGIFPQYRKSNVALILTTIAVIITTLIGFANNKIINTDKILLRRSLSSLRGGIKKTKVLVVDDFDRIDEYTQKELYKIFNAVTERNKKKNSCLTRCIIKIIDFFRKKLIKIAPGKSFKKLNRGKARIIFVGDLGNIEPVKNNYLRKIIDQKISLPFLLNIQSFAPKIAEIISKNLDSNTDLSFIEKLFIDEHRTLRDANQFLSYVEDEFIKRDKIGRVQIDQQLFVIYLYLFHKNSYQKLFDDWQKEKEKSDVVKMTEAFKKQDLSVNSGLSNNDKETKSALKNYQDNILSDDEKYPIEFERNQAAYFIDELVTNRSISELDRLISQNDKLQKLFYVKDDDNNSDYQEFYQYIKYMPDENYAKIKSKLDEIAITTMTSEVRHIPNSLTILVYEKVVNLIEQNLILRAKPLRKQNRAKCCINKIAEYFNELRQNVGRNFSMSEQLYIYRTCFSIYGSYNSSPGGGKDYSDFNRYSLTKYLSGSMKDIENKPNFGKQDYDAEILLVQLGYTPIELDLIYRWYPGIKLATIESKVEKIEQLSDREYCTFWDVYLGNIEQARVSENLNFEYNGKNYGDVVIDHYKKITSDNAKND